MSYNCAGDLLMKLLNKFDLVVKKSKFISYYYEINDIEDVELIVKDLKLQWKKASHFVFAYKIENVIKKNDDNEPSGTAGNPILNVIQKKNLNNVLIVVIRYFGGIKLGAGGLIRAYSKSASKVTELEKELND